MDTAYVVFFFRQVSASAIFSNVQWTLLLLVVLIATSLLGYMLGMAMCYPGISDICRKCNGTPLKAGDQVLILSGPEKGNTARVYTITLGQGGQTLARLDLGQEREKKFTDMFEEYSLLRISKGEQRGEGNGTRPIR